MITTTDKFVLSSAYHHLKAFAVVFYPEYMFAKHNRLIIDKLEAVEQGKIKKLMVNVAPRGGKSMLSSELFPAWYLGRNPTKNVIGVSYGQELADTFGRKVRNILRDPMYQNIFKNVYLAEDSASIKKFSTNKGGGYYATGVMGALSGKGTDCLIIDDTLRNRQDANSKLIKTNLIDWYRSTAFTRLTPDGSQIILNTRWSQDDLCGYLLDKEDDWEVVNIPAINTNGESYWPEKWPVERLEQIKKTIGSVEFSALYQQEPAPSEGGMFNSFWFQKVAAVPKTARRIRYWDRAATVQKSGSDPDYTVGLKMAVVDGIFYIEDIIRMRDTSYNVQKAIMDAAMRDGVECMVGLEQDPGSAGKAEIDYLIRSLYGYNVRAFRVTNAKAVRAGPVSAQAEAGNIKYRHANWNEAFLDEVGVFPFGKHDDQVDALSGAFNALSEKKFSYVDFVKM